MSAIGGRADEGPRPLWSRFGPEPSPARRHEVQPLTCPGSATFRVIALAMQLEVASVLVFSGRGSGSIQ
jgi:hypothetical protein